MHYEPFIIGDESHSIKVKDKRIYNSYTSTDGVYGGEVEIKSFVQIYNVNVLQNVYRSDNSKPNEIRRNDSNYEALTVLLSGVIYASHCDVIK